MSGFEKENKNLENEQVRKNPIIQKQIEQIRGLAVWRHNSQKKKSRGLWLTACGARRLRG